VGNSDWEFIKKIKQTLSIPVFANGGIKTFEDVQKCLEETGADGVMSAEALLENPALFSGKIYCLDSLALEYLDIWEKYDNFNEKYIKPHLFKMLHEGLRIHQDLRLDLSKATKIDEYRKIVNELKERRKDTKLEDKFGWYDRYRNYNLEAHHAVKGMPEKKNDGLNEIEMPTKKLKIE